MGFFSCQDYIYQSSWYQECIRIIMKFQKGQSGNPSGRPKENNEVKELAKKHTKKAIERLAFWMNSDDPKASVAASNALLDRGYGKPSQEIDHKGELNLIAVIRDGISK